MLSGTALLRGMTNSCFEELGTFKPSFHHQHRYFEAKNEFDFKVDDKIFSRVKRGN